MTEFKTSDLLDDATLEIVAGGIIKQCPGPIIPTKTGPFDPFPIPFIPLGPFRW